MLYTQSCLTDIYQIKWLYIKTHSDRFSYMVKKFIKKFDFQLDVVTDACNPNSRKWWEGKDSMAFLVILGVEASLDYLRLSHKQKWDTKQKNNFVFFCCCCCSKHFHSNKVICWYISLRSLPFSRRICIFSQLQTMFVPSPPFLPWKPQLGASWSPVLSDPGSSETFAGSLDLSFHCCQRGQVRHGNTGCLQPQADWFHLVPSQLSKINRG